MKGFIFAAGFGERMRPISWDIPKPLIPVMNIPSICYSVMLLKEAGINNIICNLHYKGDEIINYFKANDFFGIDIAFSMEDQILGTGGGLKKCERYLKDDLFIVLNSDVIIDIELDDVIEYHNKNSSPATIVLHKTSDAKNIGSVGVRENEIVDFKNFLNSGVLSDYVYTGAAVLSPEIFKYLHTDFSSIVYTGYVDIIKKRTLGYYEHKSFWEDMGSLKSFRLTNMKLLNDMDLFRERMSEYLKQEPVPVHPDAEIIKGATVINSVIGNNSFIDSDVCIENSVVLPECVLKTNQIKNSIVYRDRIIKAE